MNAIFLLIGQWMYEGETILSCWTVLDGPAGAIAAAEEQKLLCNYDSLSIMACQKDSKEKMVVWTWSRPCDHLVEVGRREYDEQPPESYDEAH